MADACSECGDDCEGVLAREATPELIAAVQEMVDERLAAGEDPEAIARDVDEIKSQFWEPWGSVTG